MQHNLGRHAENREVQKVRRAVFRGVDRHPVETGKPLPQPGVQGGVMRLPGGAVFLAEGEGRPHRGDQLDRLGAGAEPLFLPASVEDRL